MTDRPTPPPETPAPRGDAPPPVCTGTGSSARVPALSDSVLTVGQCGICGQTVPLILDGTGRCATHAYRPLRQPEETGSAVQSPACDRCSVGVMDMSNPHRLGTCDCECHKRARETP